MAPSTQYPPEPQHIHKPELTTLAKHVEELVEPKTVAITGPDGRAAHVLVVAKGQEIHQLKPLLDAYRTEPERRRGKATLRDLASFIAFVTRFKDDDSAIFADPTPAAPSLVAVLDYHRAGSAAAPRFGEHRAVYPFPLSDEWRAWKAADGVSMNQKQFAEFIEDRIADIIDPGGAGESASKLAASVGGTFASPARMLELSRGLSIRVDETVKQAINLSTGEAQIVYVADHRGENNEPIKIPNLFIIGIPVFHNGAPYQIAVRLRYRNQSGKLTWFFELYREEKVFDHAFSEACREAETATGLPVFQGAPES